MSAAENFEFLRRNQREEKPRRCGLTEVRGSYYSVAGRRYLEDLFEAAGRHIDSLKYAGGAFTLMPPEVVRELNELCHRHDVAVSTGGFIEYVLTQGPETVERYIRASADLGFDIIEISAGFISLPPDDWLRLIEQVQKAGLKAKPEIGIQFGAGGDTPAAELQAEGVRDVGWLISQARRFLEAGVELIMIESEGITENADGSGTVFTQTSVSVAKGEPIHSLVGVISPVWVMECPRTSSTKKLTSVSPSTTAHSRCMWRQPSLRSTLASVKLKPQCAT